MLVYAPFGGVGGFATQLVRHAVRGFGKVVEVCSRATRQCAKELGCNEVLDYAAVEDEQRGLAVLGPTRCKERTWI